MVCQGQQHHWIGTTFTVYAACADTATDYVLVKSTTTTTPADTDTVIEGICPTGTVDLGGGGSSSSRSTAVDSNDSFPNGPVLHSHKVFSWVYDVDNTSSSSATGVAYAICGKAPEGYVFQRKIATVAAGTEGTATSKCPAGDVPISGGGAVDEIASETKVEINSSYPHGSKWTSRFNNRLADSDGVFTKVICVK